MRETKAEEWQNKKETRFTDLTSLLKENKRMCKVRKKEILLRERERGKRKRVTKREREREQKREEEIIKCTRFTELKSYSKKRR